MRYRSALILLAALTGWSCSHRDDSSVTSTRGAVTGPSASVGSLAVNGPTTPLPASPSPSPSTAPSPGLPPDAVTPPGASCPAGNGSPDAVCGAGLMRHFEAVEAAVAQVVAEEPTLVDRTRMIGEDAFLVLDVDGYYEAVAERLRAAGYCASFDFTRYVLQVKEGNETSEEYDLVLSNGHMRTGPGSYLTTCTPANFPLTPADVIDRVRVGFYGIECAEGIAPPRNGERILPMQCTGILTATPKTRDNVDVDPRIHGPEITWTLTQADDYVKMWDYEGQPFNKYVHGLDPGFFTICATVQGIEGCLNGEVPTE